MSPLDRGLQNRGDHDRLNPWSTYMLLPRPLGSLFLGKLSLSLWYITQTTPLSFTKLAPTKEALIPRW